MNPSFILEEEESFHGFIFNYRLGKSSDRETYVAFDSRGRGFMPIMVRVNGQYFSDGSGWWGFMASGTNGGMFHERHNLSDGLPRDMPAWQEMFVKSALDRMAYEMGNVDAISEDSLKVEKWLINTESEIGFQSIKKWTSTLDDSTLETYVSVTGDTITTRYEEQGRRRMAETATTKNPAHRKGIDETLLWSRAGYQNIFLTQIDETLSSANPETLTTLGFKKGKYQIGLNLGNKVESILVGGIYKAIGLN